MMARPFLSISFSWFLPIFGGGFLRRLFDEFFASWLFASLFRRDIFDDGRAFYDFYMRLLWPTHFSHGFSHAGFCRLFLPRFFEPAFFARLHLFALRAP